MNIEFCLPVYNEEEILKNNVIKLFNYCIDQDFKFNWKIVLIINGSTDNSLQIANELCRNLQNKIKVENFKKSGKGYSIKRYFLKSRADIVAYMDIDLAVSLENIYDLIKPILYKNYDLVVGSRMLPNSRINRSFLREFSSKSYNFLSRIILNNNFSDLQCGFKAIKMDVFRKIAPYIKNSKWFIDTELIAFANFFKYKIEEIPIDWEENRYDERKSKVNVLKDSIKFIFNLIKLRMRLRIIKTPHQTGKGQKKGPI